MRFHVKREDSEHEHLRVVIFWLRGTCDRAALSRREAQLVSGYTEEQAKRHNCPLVARDINESTRCIGSACMAWRWTEHLFDGPDSYVSEPGPKGYCGLAGPLEIYKSLPAR